MVETKPYRSDRWHWHSIRDRYKIQSEWTRRHNVTCMTFLKYFCGPRYNLLQILKILSLLLLSGTCLFNLKSIIETGKKLENHRLVLDFGEDNDIVPFDEEDYFSHLKSHNDVPPKSFEIKALSSKDHVEVSVNEELVHYDNEKDAGRGIHVVVLHETTGEVMSQRVFDTYSMKQDGEMIAFLNSISNGRILVFAVKDDASFHLGEAAKKKLHSLGSNQIGQLGWRSSWAMVSSGKGVNHAEKLGKATDEASWAGAVEIIAHVDSMTSPGGACHWPENPETTRRAHFCSRFDGYGDLCRCENPSSVTFDTAHRVKASDVPVAIIASNRPQYLYRMLRSLLSAEGANPDRIVVFIDGQFEEPYEVARLFGLRAYHHVPVGVKNTRISQHYKSSLGAIFTIFMNADKVIVLEEDLDVSPDFFSYFSQTMHLLDVDPSLYCISAWNDQGYEHSVHDPSLIYRVETMPGLGWMLKRSLFEKELEPNWPSQEKRWDWDMWMRTDSMRKDRECIIPDVSRTFHFGSTGVNMNTYFFDMYFEKHAINKKPQVKLKDVEKMEKSAYEQLMHSVIRKGIVGDHSKTPCDADFMPISNEQNNTYVIYFRMNDEGATDVFLEILKCLKIWDLEARGLHKGAFRTFLQKQHLIFIGYPYSPYSLYKPADITPIFIKLSRTKDAADL